MAAGFEAGKNIAMKVPPHQYEATVTFYRDILGLELIDDTAESSVVFRFGAVNLWIDCVPSMSQAEIWLEIRADDTQAAARKLAASGIVRCDDIEPLGDLDAFWISSPAAVVHLVVSKGRS